MITGDRKDRQVPPVGKIGQIGVVPASTARNVPKKIDDTQVTNPPLSFNALQRGPSIASRSQAHRDQQRRRQEQMLEQMLQKQRLIGFPCAADFIDQQYRVPVAQHRERASVSGGCGGRPGPTGPASAGRGLRIGQMAQ